LRDYIANPQAKVRGNRMPYGGLANPGDLDDLIAYLKDYK
jgi:cytochrome c